MDIKYVVVIIFFSFILGFVLAYILNKRSIEKKKVGTISINIDDIDIDNVRITFYNPKRLLNSSDCAYFDVIYEHYDNRE